MRTALLILAALAFPALAGAATIEDLSWMTGQWSQREADGAVTREAWMPAMDGQMLGVSQEGRSGRPPGWEFERIEARGGALVFTATLPGQPPTEFTAIVAGPDEVVFENKDHDFPQRVIYRRCGDDLCARIEGTIHGQADGQDWRYRREAR
jgi:hypothetical protein